MDTRRIQTLVAEIEAAIESCRENGRPIDVVWKVCDPTTNYALTLSDAGTLVGTFADHPLALTVRAGRVVHLHNLLRVLEIDTRDMRHVQRLTVGPDGALLTYDRYIALHMFNGDLNLSGRWTAFEDEVNAVGRTNTIVAHVSNGGRALTLRL
jgi:hypothetical protein